jgi:PPOX class probable F420-dependent enzyme
MRLDETVARRRFAAARVARLATVDPDGRPHLVPVTFAVRDDLVVIAVDQKPKTTQRLQRLRNIEANPTVSLLVDHYDEDWTALWWVRADGTAEVLHAPDDRAEPVGWLAEKYGQYRAELPTGPVIRVRVTGWRGWAYRPVSP